MAKPVLVAFLSGCLLSRSDTQAFNVLPTSHFSTLDSTFQHQAGRGARDGLSRSKGVGLLRKSSWSYSFVRVQSLVLF